MFEEMGTCVPSSDDRARTFGRVCFKTQSHSFRDLHWPSPRLALASEMCFIWPTWWFYLKIELGFKSQEISSTCLDFWCPLENRKIWQNPSHNPHDSPFLDGSTCRLLDKGKGPVSLTAVIRALTSLFITAQALPFAVVAPCDIGFFSSLCHLPVR